MTRFAFASAVAFILIVSPAVVATDFVWSTAADGPWSDPLEIRWSPTGFPSSTSDNATISATGADYIIDLDVNVAINNFSMTSPNAAMTTGGFSFTTAGAAVLDRGVFFLEASSWSNNGTGTLTNNLSAANGDVFTVLGNSSISMTSFDQDGDLAIIGSDAIGDAMLTISGDATSSGEILVTSDALSSPHQAALAISGTLTNLGTIQFGTDGGGIRALSGTIDNSLGIITVESVGVTFNSATIIGGTIDGSGAVSVADNTSTIVRNTITNNATISLGATAGFFQQLLMDGSLTLDGTGQVLFTTDNLANNIITYFNGPATLTVGANQTIQTTSGSAGNVSFSAVDNQGTILADAGTISFNTANVTNSNVLNAVNGGALQFQGTTVSNAGETITVDATSAIELNNAAVIGGTINGSGMVRSNSATLDGITLNGVAVSLADNTSLIVRNTITNNTTIPVGATAGFFQQLLMDGSLTLDGTGQVLFTTDNLANNIITYFNGPATLTVGANQTIQTTSGSAGNVSFSAVDNQGTILADAGTISFNTANVTNSNVLNAVNGGALQFQGTTVSNAGETITVDATSAIELNNAAVIGGTINGSGMVRSNSATLDGITLNGVAVSLADNTSLIVRNTITNNTTIPVGATAGFFQQLLMDGSLTLDGTGQVLFTTDNLANNIITYFNGPATLTVGSAQTLAAPTNTSGTIAVPVVNEGEIAVDGTIQVSGGSIANADTGVISGSGTLNLGGTTLSSEGTVAPGSSAGTLTLVGDYMQVVGGTFAVELGGTSIGEFDVLEVSGTATLDGNLTVNTINGFLPENGGMFEILHADGGVTGTFATGQPHSLIGGLTWQAQYSSEAVTLAIGGALGDYNLNGVVDAADYTVWRDTLGQVAAGLAADGNASGAIDAGDYDVWKMHFGEIAGSGSGATANAAIPEPATLVLLIVGMMASFTFRRAAVS